jgi:hypothetical protein
LPRFVMTAAVVFIPFLLSSVVIIPWLYSGGSCRRLLFPTDGRHANLPRLLPLSPGNPQRPAIACHHPIE